MTAFHAMEQQVQEAQAIILRLELALSEALRPVDGNFCHVDRHGVQLTVTEGAIHLACGWLVMSVELPDGVRLGRCGG